MTQAYKCDRCEEFHEGTPHQYIAWGPRPGAASSRVRFNDRTKALCKGCWEILMDCMNGAE